MGRPKGSKNKKTKVQGQEQLQAQEKPVKKPSVPKEAPVDKKVTKEATEVAPDKETEASQEKAETEQADIFGAADRIVKILMCDRLFKRVVTVRGGTIQCPR